MSNSDLSSRILETYVATPGGITSASCRELGLEWDACVALEEHFERQEFGLDVPEAVDALLLSSTGIEEEATRLIAGEGTKALQRRAAWLEDHSRTKWYRSDYDEGVRSLLERELISINTYTGIQLTELDLPKPDLKPLPPAEIQEKYYARLVDIILNDPNKEHRSLAAKALSLQDPATRARLLESLRNGDVLTRGRAIEALALHLPSDAGIVRELAEALKREENPGLVSLLQEALLENEWASLVMADSAVFSALKIECRSGDAQRRRMALKILSFKVMWLFTRHARELCALFSKVDPDKAVTVEAVRGLVSLHWMLSVGEGNEDFSLTGKAIARILDDRGYDPEIKARMIESFPRPSLSRHSYIFNIFPLSNSLKRIARYDRNPSVRAAAIEKLELTQVVPPPIVPVFHYTSLQVFIGALYDRSADVRLAGVRALFQSEKLSHPGPDLFRHLSHLLNDDDPRVREAVIQGLNDSSLTEMQKEMPIPGKGFVSRRLRLSRADRGLSMK